ncbi:MAG: hypothetical protein ABSG33_11060 [Candidatus Bathyarchaeia archaeon]
MKLFMQLGMPKPRDIPNSTATNMVMGISAKFKLNKNRGDIIPRATQIARKDFIWIFFTSRLPATKEIITAEK